jgi:uncharacterized protein with von Willebrand factor type A (vWA) domain
MSRSAVATAADAQVYAATGWQRYLHGARSAAGSTLAGATGDLAGALAGALATAGASTGLVDTGAIRAEAAPFARELFARLYDDPAALDAPTCAWADKAHKALADLPEFADLRREVEGDADFAAIAAAGLLGKVAEQAANLIPSTDQEAADQRAAERGLPTSEDRARAALRRAAAEAATEAREGRAALAGLAPGLGSVPRDADAADPVRMQLAEKLLKSKDLRAIMARVGRLVALASARNSAKASAPQEVVDVERGGDVARLLPSVLGLLGDSDLELLALKDIVERGALQYRMAGKEPQGRGPIVVLTDASGSMEGHGMQVAVALCLAAIQIARKDRRPIALASFDTRILDVVKVDAKGDATDRNGAPIGSVANAAMRIAGWQAEGGTDFDVPLTYALGSLGLADDRADLVFVTDGHASVAPSTLAALKAAKARGLRVYGATVGGGRIDGAVGAICDEIADLDKHADGAANLLPRR